MVRFSLGTVPNKNILQLEVRCAPLRESSMTIHKLTLPSEWILVTVSREAILQYAGQICFQYRNLKKNNLLIN